MNDKIPSLAARVHQFAAAGDFDTPLSVTEQQRLFGVALETAPVAFRAAFSDDGQMTVTWRDPEFEIDQSMTLEAIQSKIEAEDDAFFEDVDGLTVDMYRSFPRDAVDVYAVRNDGLGRKHRVFGADAEDAKDLFARYNGYDGWAEMRSLSMDGDRDEYWIIERAA